MRTSLLTIFMIVMISFAANATPPLTGIKTIQASGGDYTTVAAAIADLNTFGVGTGGVIFNIAADHKELFTHAYDGHITTLTSSAANPVTFQKSGTGAKPKITAAVGEGSMDAIFRVAGSDFITFDGLDINENANNGEPTAWMEWGFAILKASAGDGTQHVTIKNCQITFDEYNKNATGIYANNHTVSSLSQLVVNNAAGTNSYLQIFGNTLLNCYRGIYLKGFAAAAPFTFYDQNNAIGKDGANTISHIGGDDVIPYGIYTSGQDHLTVANNTVTSNMVGKTSVYGIYMTASTNATFDLYNNTVSLQFISNNPLNPGMNEYLNGIYCDMGLNGTTNVANIYNNLVTGCTYDNAMSAVFRGIYLYSMGVTAEVYGNVVSNNTIGSTGTEASGPVHYLRCQKLSTVPGSLVLHDNIVSGNARVIPASLSAETFMLSILGSGTTLDAYNNSITNNSVASYGSAICLWISFDDESGKFVHHNTISNITNADGSVVGIKNSNGTTGLFYNNKISGIHSSPSSTLSNLSGIYQAAEGLDGNSGMYFYNNTVSDLSNPAAVAELGYDYNTCSGIYVEYSFEGAKYGFYNNTVYLDVTPLSTEYGSSALCASALVGVDLVNNIFVNVSGSSGSNGKTVGIRARNPLLAGFTANYNDIYAGTPGSSNLIFHDGSSGDQTLIQYKGRVFPQEAQSITELPPFVNVAALPYDLHIKTTVSTQIESGGTEINSPVPVYTDMDGDQRFPHTGYPENIASPAFAPDLGADEFGGLTNDLSPPRIVYTPLTAINNGLDRTLTATITDGSGVPTSGFGLPMLYWRINGSVYTGVQAVSIGDGNYTFTFGYGAGLNDVVYYYIVAQDNHSPINVGSNPALGASGFSANPPACTTPPSNPSSYSIITDISGIKHVGVGKDYTTLTAAATDLNSKYMAGPVTFILDDDTYPSENYPIRFNGRPGNSSANTLTIKPNTGKSPVISGASPTGIIIFNGIDYALLDGSNNGTTSQNLTIQNTQNTSFAYTVGISNNGGTDPSKYVTLQNCVLMASNADVAQETYVIVVNANGGVAGGGYDNCLFTNNTIQRAKFGIYISATAGNPNRNIVISNNTIGSTVAANYLLRFGIAIDNSDNTLVADNDIMGPAAGVALDQLFGIYYGGFASNTKIHRNKIHDWYAFGLGSFGIKCSSANSTTPTEIFNNLFYNNKCYGMNQGVSNNNSYGIFVRQGGNIKMWHNTIYLSGDYLVGVDSYAPSSSCIAVYTASSHNLDIRNNIFRNSMTNSSNPLPGSGAEGRAYGIMFEGEPTMFINMDYNDYFIDGYRGTMALDWNQLVQTYYETLADWQVTGNDLHSLNLNPAFVSDVDPMNLHVTNLNLNSVCGQKILDTDYAGATRFNPPDMGCYEWSSTVTNYHTLAATSVGASSATLNGDINTNGEVVEVHFDYGLTTSYGNSVAGTPASARSVGSLLPVSAAITGLQPNTTYHFRFWGIPTTSGQSNIYGADMTFTTPDVPVILPVATTVSNTQCFNATQTIIVAGTPNTFVVTPTGIVTMIAGQNIKLLPGTTVQPGGYLHGYISNEYCSMTDAPYAPEATGTEEPAMLSTSSSIRVYPNPTSGVFTLEIKDEAEPGKSNVEIFSMRGDKVFSTEITGNGKHELSLSGKPAGIYVIRVISGNKTETARLIKQ